MSSAVSEVPPPREVWRAALDGREVTMTVQREGGEAVHFRGEVCDRRKDGGTHETSVTVRVRPDGALAALELEAVKENGRWGPFHAFQWREGRDVTGELDTWYRYVGPVTALDIPGVRWSGTPAQTAADTGEVGH